MTISKQVEGNAAVVSFGGRLDTMTSPEAQEQLLPVFDECEDVTLDFSSLEYISSAGLRVLLAAQKKAASKRGKMALCNVPSQIMEVLEMTGLKQVLTIK